MAYEKITKDEMAEMIAERDRQISEMAETVRALADENQALKDQLLQKPPVSGGLSGWLVVTPANPMYSGITCGYQFRAGRAFIARTPGRETEQENIIRQMRNDFGYQVKEVENYLDMPADARAQIERSMVDVLSVPQAV